MKALEFILFEESLLIKNFSHIRFMKIMYHVANDWTDKQIEVMSNFNIPVKKGYTSVQIEEEKYLKIKQYLDKWIGSEGIRSPEFTKQEIEESLVSVKNGWHVHGYPMPEMDFGYREITYHLNDFCEKCGIGLKQKDAFRLKSVPPLGKKQLFGLEWVYDELFVEKKVYNEVFKPIGIQCRDVLHYKKGTPFENTLQLIIPETKEKLNLNDYPTETCEKCGKTKFLSMPLGFYPMPKNIIAPIFKSRESFGSGASAFKRIFVNKSLRDKLISHKIERPKWYIPCKE